MAAAGDGDAWVPGAPVAPGLRGVGIGWRPELAPVIAGLPGLTWVEVIAESVPGVPPTALAALQQRGVAVVPHGVRLSLGSADGLDPHRVAAFTATAEGLRAPLVSEHIAFVAAGGVEAGHLLPLPKTVEAAELVARHARAVAADLTCPLALEPIASFVDWPEDELDEAEFVTEVIERSGCLLLLDVANVYANAVNRGTDPMQTLSRMPLERLAYVHVAGGLRTDDGIYHDTHTTAAPPEVLDLLSTLSGLSSMPAVMLERDGDFPHEAELIDELDRIADSARLSRITGR